MNIQIKTTKPKSHNKTRFLPPSEDREVASIKAFPKLFSLNPLN